MLRHPPTHPFPPAPKTRRLQTAPHHLDNLRLPEPCLLLDLIKGRPIFPSHPDNLISQSVTNLHQFTSQLESQKCKPARLASKSLPRISIRHNKVGSFFRSKAPNNAIPHKRPQQLTKLKKDPQVVLTTEGDPPPSLPGSGKIPFQIKNQSDSHLQLI